VYEREIDIEALQAGRELDALVEERVIGARQRTPAFFSKSQSASLQLEQHLRRLGWTGIGRETRPGPASGLTLRVQLRHEDGGTVEASAQAFEEALCKAALKAVEP